MKICPACGERFEGEEAFCPHDGTRLEPEADGVGEFVGGVLSEIVRLDELIFADEMGERCIGTMVDSGRKVYATVFNRAFRPAEDALQLVETARARVGSPMPLALTTILRAELEKTPPFIIETAPAGQSLRGLIREKGRLDWQHAVRVGANVARIIGWLNERGVTHHGLHPASIFVKNLDAGEIQLGEWYSEDAQWVEHPMSALERDADAFVGYVAYMAPELVDSTEGADLRTAVYALGALIYEMTVGKPPFVAPTNAEVLRRHRHEQPVTLSVARGGGELHPDLDQLVQMMLSKDPDHRFQSPAAIVAALANLLGEDPESLAPEVERADSQQDDDLYATIEMSQIDRDSLSGLQESISPDERQEVDSGVAKTLMMGSAQPGLEQAAVLKKAPSVEASKSEESSETGDEEQSVDSPDVSKSKVEDAGSESGPSVIVSMDNDTDDVGTRTSEPDEVAEASEDEEKPAELEEPAEVEKPAEEEPAGAEEAAEDAADEAEESAAKASSIEVDPDLLGEASEAEARAEESEAEESEKDTDTSSDESSETPAESRDFKVGFVEMDRSVELPRQDDWFSRSTEDAWEDTMIREHHEAAEHNNRRVITGLIVALVIAFSGLIVYFQFVWSPEEDADTPDEDVAEVVETPGVDLAEIEAKFKEALGDDRVIAPVRNSAARHLEELKREGGEESTEYQRSRVLFVEKASAQARAADEAGHLLYARNLAGYAAQFDPENQELVDYSENLNARYRGDDGSSEAPEVEDESDDAGFGEDTLGEPDAGEEEQEKQDEKANVESAPGSPRVAPGDRRSESRETEEPSVDTRVLAKKAREAYARGNVDQARKLYENAVKADPGDHTLHAGLGQVFFDQASYSSAVRHQRNAIRLEPDRVDYRISLGQSYYRLGRYEDAIKTWETALMRDPSNQNAREYIKLARRKLN